MPVVADTGPLHYLVLIDAIEILPRLLGGVSIWNEERIKLAGNFARAARVRVPCAEPANT